MPAYLIMVRYNCFIRTEFSADMLAHSSSGSRLQRMDPPT